MPGNPRHACARVVFPMSKPAPCLERPKSYGAFLDINNNCCETPEALEHGFTARSQKEVVCCSS
jgi:hypothetical protein